MRKWCQNRKKQLVEVAKNDTNKILASESNKTMEKEPVNPFDVFAQLDAEIGQDTTNSAKIEELLTKSVEIDIGSGTFLLQSNTNMSILAQSENMLESSLQNNYSRLENSYH